MRLFLGSQVRPPQGDWLLVLLLFWLPEVQGNCTTPDPPPHSSLTGGSPEESYPIGTVLKYNCIIGYELIPGINSSITCLSTSKWSEIPIFCQGKKCRAPSIQNGKVNFEDIPRLGDNVTFFCNHGFRLIGDATIFCVLSGGTVGWSTEFPDCQRIPCARPDKILNGSYEADPHDEYYYGSVVIYHCDPDFSLIGDSTIECTVAEDNVNGKWNSAPPECKKVKCERPTVQNGFLTNVEKPSYTYNDAISFQCDPGYSPVGSMHITCGANNSWVPGIPQCLKATAHQPSSTPKHPAATTHQPNSTLKYPAETTHKTSTTSKNNAGYNIKVALGEWIIILALLVLTI